MNETELLRQFFKDYQELPFSDLISKYEAQEYLDIMNPKKLLQYAKDHNLFETMVAKNPVHIYTELTKPGDKYQIQIARGAIQEFSSLEAAVEFKLGKFVNYLFSSLNWK